MGSQSPPAREFDFLTDKQAAVLDLLAHNRTSKEIAWALGVSETAINRRIEVLRSRLGGVTRHELARRYREWIAARPGPKTGPDHTKPLKDQDTPCVETEIRILQLASDEHRETKAPQDSKVSAAAFEDPIAMSIDAPWREWKEPGIVPRVLDGENATLTRGAAIALLVLAIVASIVVALAAAKALADAVS